MMQDRYERQTAFAPFGEQGQRKLQRSRVLIVGCGALGGTVADLLVRAGTGVDGGTVTLIDPDVVQIGNLHRQILFTEDDARQSRLKVEAARNALIRADERARVDILADRFDDPNAVMLENFDLLIDATDNIPSRFVMNRAAVRFGKPFVTAGINGASGQLLSVLPGETPCLECLFDPKAKSDLKSENASPPESWPAILGPLPQFFASLQTLEALKILSGNRDAVNRCLLVVDLWNNRISQIQVRRNADCPICFS